MTDRILDISDRPARLTARGGLAGHRFRQAVGRFQPYAAGVNAEQESTPLAPSSD